MKNVKSLLLLANRGRWPDFSGTTVTACILGNGKITDQKAHDIYSKKDVIEKAFMKYKNLLGFHRRRVHSDF